MKQHLHNLLILAASQAALLGASTDVDHSLIENAATPEAKGEAIAIAADQRDTGWGDWSANASMVLSNAYGQTSSRTMRLAALEQKSDGDKRLITFSEPRDVKGTGFLVYSSKEGDDDRWLYLPALKRVKRISSSNQSGPFVGSEFAYEDLSSQEPEKYTYKFIGEDSINGMEAYIIERYSTDSKSGYTKEVVWYDKEEFRQLKIDFYDRKSTLLKTFEAKEFQLYNNEFWRADSFTMVNHQNGKSTQLLWSDYTFSKGLNERNFDQRSLRNVK